MTGISPLSDYDQWKLGNPYEGDYDREPDDGDPYDEVNDIPLKDDEPEVTND